MRRLSAVVLILLVVGCGSESRPRPDLVFVSTRDGDYAIFGINADGSSEQRLTRGEEGDPATPQGLFFQVDPAWSPDGRRIVFASRRDGKSHLFVMHFDGSGNRRLTSTDQDDGDPAWSPDGRTIAFTRGTPGDLYVASPDGSGVRRVGHDSADEREPEWSPDGKWLAYVRRTPGTSARELWLMHPDASGRRQLTRLDAASYGPAWSADGSRIAFSSDRLGGRFGIFTIRLDGKGLRRLTVPTIEAIEPAWSPDGNLTYSGNGTIYVLVENRDQPLTDGENDSSPAWRP